VLIDTTAHNTEHEKSADTAHAPAKPLGAQDAHPKDIAHCATQN